MARSLRKKARAQNVLVPHFPLNELLFRRFKPEAFKGGRLTLDAIKLPDMSVNRGSMSSAVDVLNYKGQKYRGWGVASFRVDQIPTPIHQPAKLFEIRPEHDPFPADDPQNEAHSEIRLFDNGVHLTWDEDDDPVRSQDQDFVEAHYRWRFQLRHALLYPITPGSPQSES